MVTAANAGQSPFLTLYSPETSSFSPSVSNQSAQMLDSLGLSSSASGEKLSDQLNKLNPNNEQELEKFIQNLPQNLQESVRQALQAKKQESGSLKKEDVVVAILQAYTQSQQTQTAAPSPPSSSPLDSAIGSSPYPSGYTPSSGATPAYSGGGTSPSYTGGSSPSSSNSGSGQPISSTSAPVPTSSSGSEQIQDKGEYAVVNGLRFAKITDVNGETELVRADVAAALKRADEAMRRDGKGGVQLTHGLRTHEKHRDMIANPGKYGVTGAIAPVGQSKHNIEQGGTAIDVGNPYEAKAYLEAQGIMHEPHANDPWHFVYHAERDPNRGEVQVAENASSQERKAA